MEELSLESFLRGEASLGRQVDRGRFRLDPAQALEKLSKFALPEPGLWVVKLVQAAVACGADEIAFTFLRRQVKVDFLNAQNWQADQLLTALMSGVPPQEEPAQRHFVTAILGAAVGFTQKVSWSCGQTFVRVTADGPAVEANTRSAERVLISATRPWKPKVKAPTFSSPMRYLLRQTAHEFMALVKHCRTSPIAVTCDTFKVPRSYECQTTELPQSADYDSERSDGQKKVLASFPVEALDPAATLVYPIDEQQLSDPEQPQEKFQTLRLPPQGERVGAVCCLYLCRQRKSRINFVLDGVLLESCELFLSSNHPLPSLLHGPRDQDDLVLDVYLPVTWQDLDLTQFGVREKTALRDLILEALSLRLREVLIHQRQYCDRPWDLSAAPAAAKLPWSLGEVLITGVLTPFIPHFLVLGGVYLCALPFVYAVKPFTGGITDYFHRKTWEPLARHLDRIIDGLQEL